MSDTIPMSQTRLSVFVASSLDGYIATRDGSLAWLEQAARSDEDYGYESFLQGVDALAMGRGTYNHIAHLDPLPFGGRPVFVFTHHRPRPREGVTFWQEPPVRALERWNTMGLRGSTSTAGLSSATFSRRGSSTT
jgi:dihydrofolate reductase